MDLPTTIPGSHRTMIYTICLTLRISKEEECEVFLAGAIDGYQELDASRCCTTKRRQWCYDIGRAVGREIGREPT